ncbi:MAG: multifunctional CCA tRNA nucleotidyl transferase/2'3'-cyclic phosphodiesterase/2'nucleotidase/phosphatase [Burkholderiaceae bacterium]
MDIYLVGGAVRDTLLGLPVKDRDWVVVGASPQQLLDQGFVPVGKDFPVFLHPATKEEYALARTERNTAPGYKGFAFHAAPDVTLEQDLARRDLTINAMAVAQEQLDNQGNFDPTSVRMEDPFHGQRDLQLRRLRHVTGAFGEDPVRILRVARFAARFAQFHVAHETRDLMRRMVLAGEIDALVAERVWQELARGLMEQRPSHMFDVLADCAALTHLLPELPATGVKAAAGGCHANGTLDHAALWRAPLTVRFAAMALFMPSDTARSAVCERLRVPTDCRDLALLAARERQAIDASTRLDAAALVELLERCDGLRKPARFRELLQLCAIMASAPDQSDPAHYAPQARLQAVLSIAQSVATDAIARRVMAAGQSGPQVGAAIQAARIAAVAAGNDVLPAA